MKHLLILMLLPLFSTGQTSTKINLDLSYAIGQVAMLPDTIILYSKFNQLTPQKNYTKLKCVKENTYQLEYWEIEGGGIVDPTEYKYNLKVKQKSDEEITLNFHDRKRTYFLKCFKLSDGLTYQLIAK